MPDKRSSQIRSKRKRQVIYKGTLVDWHYRPSLRVLDFFKRTNHWMKAKSPFPHRKIV